MKITNAVLIATKTRIPYTVYPKKYAHGFCLAVLCCGYTLTDFPISIRLTSLALWQSNDCPSASKATLMNMDKYFMWIHYERLHNHNKAKHNKTVCTFLGIYCTCLTQSLAWWASEAGVNPIFPLLHETGLHMAHTALACRHQTRCLSARSCRLSFPGLLLMQWQHCSETAVIFAVIMLFT